GYDRVRSETSCLAARTRRLCRKRDNRADDSKAETRACPCGLCAPAEYRFLRPCLLQPQACRPFEASASFPLPPGTCGKRLAETIPGNSRKKAPRCPGAWVLRLRACPG